VETSGLSLHNQSRLLPGARPRYNKGRKRAQDLNNDVIADHIENWIRQNVQ